MTKKNLKLIMELIFIFIIPLVILCINCNYSNEIEYDNNGNYQSTEKHIEFITPFTYSNGYKNVINNFNLFNGIWENSKYINPDSGELGDYIGYSTTDYIEIPSNTLIYIKVDGTNTQLSGDSIVFFNVNKQHISGFQHNVNINGFNNPITTPNNAKYMRFDVPTSIKYNINVNISVSWANGNYVPYGKPLILYTNTDISGQNDINYTIWGNLKNLIVDNLQIQDNQLVDIIITYTILWFIHFVIWHFFYLFFDGLVHIFIDWGNKEKEKVK